MSTEEFITPSPRELGDLGELGDLSDTFSQISHDDLSNYGGFEYEDGSYGSYELPDDLELPDIPLSPTCCFDDEEEDDQELHSPVVIIKKEPPNREWGLENDNRRTNDRNNNDEDDGLLPPLNEHPLFQEDDDQTNLYPQNRNLNPMDGFVTHMQGSREIVEYLKQYVTNNSQRQQLPPLPDDLIRCVLSLKHDLNEFARQQISQGNFGNNSVGFDVRHLKKKKRTRLSSVYQDPLSLIYYIVFKKELRLVCFPKNRFVSDALKSLSDEEIRKCVDWRISFSEPDLRELKLKNVKKTIMLNGNCEETCILEASYIFRKNSTFKFKVNLLLPGENQEIKSESNTIRILGYCDAQFRKKCNGEFSNRNYNIKCDPDDLL